MKKLVLYALLICVPFIGFSQTESDEQSNWEWNITPYLWLTGTNGNVDTTINQGGIGATLTDNWDPLEATGLLSLEVNKGRWSIMASAFYAKIDKQGTLTNNFNSIDLGETVNVKSNQTFVELGGAYNFAQLDSFVLKVLFGARYFSFDTELKGGESNPLYSDTNNFIDPYIGLGFSNYWNKFGVMGSIDVGGFGVGSEISTKYNLMFGYQFIDLLEVKLGYQAYLPVYESDEIDYSLTTKGLLLGLDFSF